MRQGKKLTEPMAVAVRNLAQAEQVPQKDIASRFNGISICHVSNIKHWRKWKEASVSGLCPPGEHVWEGTRCLACGAIRTKY